MPALTGWPSRPRPAPPRRPPPAQREACRSRQGHPRRPSGRTAAPASQGALPPSYPGRPPAHNECAAGGSLAPGPGAGTRRREAVALLEVRELVEAAGRVRTRAALGTRPSPFVADLPGNGLHRRAACNRMVSQFLLRPPGASGLRSFCTKLSTEAKPSWLAKICTTTGRTCSGFARKVPKTAGSPIVRRSLNGYGASGVPPEIAYRPHSGSRIG